MKVAIVGSRDYPDLDHVRNYVDGLIGACVQHNEPLIIVTGGARGVDRTVEESAERWNGQVEVVVLKADWNRVGRGAGYVRNIAVVNYIQPDGRAVCFWDGLSRGTKHVIDLCIESMTDFEVQFPRRELKT